jgi:hypothetical protein
MKTTFVILFLSISYFSIGQDGCKFPDSWLGTYEGDMYILRAHSERIDTVDVIFEFLATNQEKRWTYRMTYKSPKYGDIVKDYEIIKPDSLAKNVYLLDEKDGIYIEEVLMGNTLYSAFSVAGSRLVSVLRKEEDELFLEIFSSKDKSTLTSKNKADKPENVFEVKSFAPFTVQFVRFKKIE